MQRSLLPQSYLVLWHNLNHEKEIIRDLQGRFTDVRINKISKCTLHLVEVQDVNLKSTGIAPWDGYTFFCEKGTWRPFFESNREEVTGDWRILCSDKLCGVYSHQVLFR
jgi:hypothetical protein